MTIRFNAIDQVNNGVAGIKSGYDTGLKSDLVIPSCGIEDVDTALFYLFDKEIQPITSKQDSTELKKVPIVFAAGEKWALLKRGRPIRDKNNTLILPLITIMRTGLSQGPEDLSGRGINQQTGELIVRRRLDKSDRNYQNLLNKSFITSQKNIFVNPDDSNASNQAKTNRNVGESRSSLEVRKGGLLASNLGNNIYETVVVPAPQFYTAMYQITIWTQYTQHMNQIIEKIVASCLPQAQSWKIITNKGYWFIASMDNGAFDIETNFDDMSTSERYIRCSFNLKVPAYFWLTNSPGSPIPIKKYVSSPIIQFSLSQTGLPDATTNLESSNNFVIGNDDPTLPIDDKFNARPDQRRTGSSITPKRGVVQTANPEIMPAILNPELSAQLSEEASAVVVDPAAASAARGVEPPVYVKNTLPVYPSNDIEISIGNEVNYVKIVSENKTTGETVYTSTNLGDMKIIPTNKL